MQQELERQLERQLERYDGTWREIRERNVSLCARGAEVRVAVKQASNCCEQAASGWRRLQAELVAMPSTIQLMEDTTGQVTAASAQIDALEQRLTALTAVRERRAEARWRQQKLLEAEQHEARRRDEVEHLQQQMARQTLNRQQQAQAERRQIFDRQFEEQKQYVLQHGVDASQPVPVPLGVAPRTLADVRPGKLVDDAELDAFYDD